MNKIKIYVVSISIFVVLVTILINSSYAQSSDNFKNYTNKALGFSIQHPSKWKPPEEPIQYEDLGIDQVIFTIRENPEDALEIMGDKIPSYSYFMVWVQKPQPYLDTNTMTLQNRSMSIEEHAKGLIDSMPENSKTLIRQNHVTLGGNQGIKVEYLDKKHDAESYGFDIFTNINGKLYKLEYEDKSLKVPETLPLADKMVESFQILR